MNVREAIDCFASGEIWISARDTCGQVITLRAGAFSSVSLKPPIVLFSSDAAGAAGISVGKACGISILSGAQGAAATEGRAAVSWECGDILGAPYVTAAAAAFEAVVFNRVECGDSTVFFAELAAFNYSESESGLLRYSGRVRGCVSAVFN